MFKWQFQTAINILKSSMDNPESPKDDLKTILLPPQIATDSLITKMTMMIKFPHLQHKNPGVH